MPLLRGILSNSTKIPRTAIKNSLTMGNIGRAPIALFRRLKSPFSLMKKLDGFRAAPLSFRPRLD